MSLKILFIFLSSFRGWCFWIDHRSHRGNPSSWLHGKAVLITIHLTQFLDYIFSWLPQGDSIFSLDRVIINRIKVFLSTTPAAYVIFLFSNIGFYGILSCNGIFSLLRHSSLLCRTSFHLILILQEHLGGIWAVMFNSIESFTLPNSDWISFYSW